MPGLGRASASAKGVPKPRSRLPLRARAARSAIRRAGKDAGHELQGGSVHGFVFSCFERLGGQRPGEPVDTNLGLQKALERLSSGYRINRSGDDAAGLVVANSYRSQQAVLTQGIRNAGDGLSTLQIKDGALNNISTLLDRLASLATQSASASSTVDRDVLDAEFQDVIAEIDREASVAGLTTSQGFSVFVSNDGADGVDRRHDRRGGRDDLGVDALGGRHGGGRGDGGDGASRRRSARSATRRRLSARCRTVCSSPSPGAVADRQHQGGREPDPRREHRGRVGEPDALQHPDAERHRGPGAGQPAERRGARAAPVVR